ncbi:MAG: universal stress protein [Candidatus Dormibacteria bacterium]
MASRFFRSATAPRPEREGVLGPQRIVVPVKGDPIDGDALRAACRLARPAKAAILVITVLEVPRHLPLTINLDRELGAAEELLGEMEELALQLGTKIETTVLQAREAGPAVVDEARRWGADLVVVGLGSPQRFGEFALDRNGEELLKRVHCRLILIRQALEKEDPHTAVALSHAPD